VSKALSIPLDPKVKDLSMLPFTISFVIRKLQQIDNLNELPKEKRPNDEIIWDGTSEEMDEWLDRVLSNTSGTPDGLVFSIADIES
jgi:hypothetical protein